MEKQHPYSLHAASEDLLRQLVVDYGQADEEVREPGEEQGHFVSEDRQPGEVKNQDSENEIDRRPKQEALKKELAALGRKLGRKGQIAKIGTAQLDQREQKRNKDGNVHENHLSKGII